MATTKFLLFLSFLVFSLACKTKNNLEFLQNQEDCYAQSDAKFLNPESDPELNIKLYLYTKNAKDEPKLIIIKGNEVEIDSSFSSTKPTKFIIHGFRSKLSSEVIQKIKNAYLQEFDYNVIAVDWNILAAGLNYLKVRRCTKEVGQKVAIVINSLVKTKNVRLEDIHVIGHSLGSHVAGFAGAFTESGKIGRISGLDPALPGYRYNTSDHLDSTDATFVDVIHSCAGGFGILQPCGHVDFFPNGGDCLQPGCSIPSIAVCSHSRSYLYFAESIINKKGFMARKCQSKNAFNANKCEGDSSLIPMGDAVPLSSRGSYYLKTKSRPNFAQN